MDNADNQAPQLKRMDDAITEYHHVMRGDLGQRVMLGYPRLDKLLRGIRPGQVCGIMARAGVGKTLIACNVIHNIYRREDSHPVLFFSLEMPAAEIAARLFAIDNQTSPESVEQYFSEAMSDPVVKRWLGLYGQFLIDDETSPPLAKIEQRYAEAERILGRSIPLIVIDYLGLISSPGNSPYERVSNIARGLKNTAKRLNCAVLVLIQTSRAGGNGGEPVTLEQGRDSGAIEEACDFLLGVWRPELSAKDRGNSGDMELAILKNRHGRTDDIEMFFDKETLRIRER